MKTAITTILISYLIAFVLVCTGRINYNNAQDAAIKCTGSDLAIEQTLTAYGFNLTWDQTPTIADYFMSNFRNTANIGINQ